MERIPLPAHIVAAQQKLTTDSNGNITRDRLLVVQQKEIVAVADPVVSEYCARQLGRMHVQEAVNSTAPGVMLICTLIPVVLIPLIIFVGVRYF